LPLALVSLVAYLVIDLLNGAPIYESLLERLLKRKSVYLTMSSMTTTEVPVLAGGILEDQQIRDLQLGSNSLITLVKRSEHVLIPKGDLVLRAGDIIYIRASQNDTRLIRNQISVKN
ncbi:TrkA C-terminal domain-containing protein, partial [Leuconostoc mesenteroides]